jgi:hypothetical protein
VYFEAGQRRVQRESKQRLVEGYVAARDAYVSGNVIVGKAKAKAKGDHTPKYAQVDKAKRGLSALMRDLPGTVSRRDSELRN